MILAICRGRRIQVSGHSDLGVFSNLGVSSILTWVQADTAWAACPVQPRSLEVISMTFAAVILDADDPCSVNTAQDPESSFTISPWQLDPCILGALSPIQHFSNDICPSMMQNELLRPTSFLHRSPLSYF